MGRDFTIRKRAVLIALGLLLAVDVALGAYSWHLASAPRRPQTDWEALTLKLKLRRADIDRADKIRRDIHVTERQFEEFEKSLLPASTGYSSVAVDLGSTAKKVGLQILTLGYKQKGIPDRNMEEVTIDATVNGDYASVVHFLNDLQRSKNLYAIDGLALASDTQNQAGMGPIRVGLHVRTYFRTGA